MISATMIAWFTRLVQRNIIRPGYSIFEFGPQDISPSASSKTTVALYTGFGATSYHSADIVDQRGEKRDFNKVFSLPEQFDVVTDFGTFEHIFNIGNAFHSMHNITKPNGLMLHVLPAFGDINHGFYNIHPMIYFQLAVINNYIIEDLLYVDKMNMRNRALEKDGHFDFNSLPIKFEHLDGAYLNSRQPLLNSFLTDTFTANVYDFGSNDTFDHCFVALRKQNNEEFLLPYAI